MLHVYYSNRAEALVEELGRQLGSQPNLFAPPEIVVPNRAVSLSVKRALATARGGIAGLPCRTLEPFLLRCLRDVPGRPLTRTALHCRLVQLLSDNDRLGSKTMAPVRRYLHPEEAGADERLRRRYEFARSLAALFHEYTVSRRGLIRSWNEGRTEIEPPLALEQWQRTLWEWATEGNSHQTILDAVLATAPEKLHLPHAIHVYGFSFLGKAHHEVLAHLAKRSEVHLFALNPSDEFWEDLHAQDEDTVPLRRWAMAALSHIRTTNEMSDWDAKLLFVPPGDTRALSAVQTQLLRLAGGGDVPRDDSVQVLACPSPRRELEVVAATIAGQMQRDDSLAYHDMCLLLPQQAIDEYRPLIGAVFDDFAIPHHVADRSLRTSNRLVEALDLLFDIPLGQYSRPELLGLMLHPHVFAAYPTASRDDWLRWAKRLGIVHGADRQDHEDTYIHRDLFHWRQGIRRLAFGACMAGEQSGERSVVRAAGVPLVVEEVPQSKLESATLFARLARDLIASSKDAAQKTMPLSAWSRHFCDSARQFITPAKDHDRGTFERCVDALAELARDDSWHHPVPYRIAREFARDALGSLRASRGASLEEGVSVAVLEPMRPLPYRSVFIAGLSEGSFPAREPHNALDLRHLTPTVDDVSGEDRDRYAFLEAILSARDSLVVSFVDRDVQTGEERPASPLVSELADLVGIAPTSHPHRRHSDTYFAQSAWPDPVGKRQWEAKNIRAQVSLECEASGTSPPDQDAWRRIAQQVLGPNLQSEQISPTIETLSLSRLRGFLECPLQAWTANVIGLREAESSDAVAQENEPFAFDRPVEVGWLREVIASHLLTGGTQSLKRRYRELFDYYELTGRVPTGVFAERARNKHLALLDAWSAQASSSDICELPAFGHARQDDSLSTLYPSVYLGAVELSGQGELCTEHGTVSFVARRPTPKAFLRGYVASLVRCAAGMEYSGFFDVRVIGAETSETRRFPAVSRDEALRYLTNLIADYTTNPHDYLWPCEAVFESAKYPKRPIAEIVGKLLGGQTFSSSSFGPIQDLRGVPAPTEAQVEHIASERFGHFLRGEVLK